VEGDDKKFFRMTVGPVVVVGRRMCLIVTPCLGVEVDVEEVEVGARAVGELDRED